MRRLAPAAFVFALLAGVAASAWAQALPGLTPDDRAAIRAIISRQLDAFRRDDGAEAFSYASPNIRAMFGTPEEFMEMVRRGYRPVYRHRSAAFGGVFYLDGKPVQKLHVVDAAGETFLALYTMERQPDGGWRIDGCHIVLPKEESL